MCKDVPESAPTNTMHIRLQPIEFTAFGLLKLLQGEHSDVVLEGATVVVPDCTIGVTHTDITGERGRLQVTTRRIIWLENESTYADPKRSCCFALNCVDGVKMSTGVMTAIGLAPKLNIRLKLGPGDSPAVTGTRIVKLTVMGDRSQVLTVQGRLSLLLGRSMQLGGVELAEVDATALENMTVMGFDHDRAHCALLCTQSDVSAAVQWLQDHATDSLAQIRRHATEATRHSSFGDRSQDELAEQLSMMGFATQAIQASREATGSSDVGVLIDWLNSNALGRGPSGGSMGGSASGLSSAHNPRYPVPNFYNGPNMLRSHPVQVLSTLEDDPTAASFYKPYQQAHQPHPAALPMAQPSHASGMEAIVAAKRAKASRIGRDVQSGFRDLQALRESGERLSKLAAELSSRTASDRPQEDLEVGLANELVDLGVINPVTKSSAGKQYHEQLSRELAFFLQQHLSKEKGMMVLHDIFCVFNRARGMELVSPDDLRIAAELFEPLGLPTCLRVFPSGVAVVQDQSWSDDAVCSTIVDILNMPHPDVTCMSLGRGLAPTQYALEATVPVAVAMEQLLLAERKGFLCRDDTACGLYFYRNVFPELSI
eukprot:jgi/Ulvmu1/7249/UM035_0036.1